MEPPPEGGRPTGDSSSKDGYRQFVTGISRINRYGKPGQRDRLARRGRQRRLGGPGQFATQAGKAGKTGKVSRDGMARRAGNVNKAQTILLTFEVSTAARAARLTFAI